jgi:hypothetical protein
MEPSLWTVAPDIVRLFLLGLFAVAVLPVLRSVRLAWREYHYPGERISTETIVGGAIDPNLLARSALADRLPFKNMAKFSSESEGAAVHILRLAEARFLYLWETCHADVGSIRRACFLSVFLSFLMVACGAYPTYFFCYNDTNLSGSYCLIVSGERLLKALSIGLSLCILLYSLSSYFERILAFRMARWKYFATTLKIVSPE